MDGYKFKKKKEIHEMDEFPEWYKWPELTQEAIENVDRPKSSKETELEWQQTHSY